MAFQAVSDDQFNADSEFTVKTSKSMAMFVGIIFFFLALGIYLSTHSYISFGLLAASLYSFYRSSKDVVIMTISRKGFFYLGKLVTDWKHFSSAKFLDEPPVPGANNLGINDQFSLLIKYEKDSGGLFGRKIRLTLDQDKSEEEILAAIRFYFNSYVKELEDDVQYFPYEDPDANPSSPKGLPGIGLEQ